MDDAKQAFQAALEKRADLHDRTSLRTDAQFLRELARSYYFNGQYQRLDGKLKDAQIAFQKGLDVLRPVAERNPTVTQYQEDLAAAYVQLGLVHRDAGELGDALGSLRTARAIQDRLVRDHPRVPWLQSQLATTYFHIGYVHGLRKERAELEESLWAYRQAEALREKVVKADPADPEHHYDFGITLNNLGLILLRLDRLDEALATVRRAGEEQRAAFDRLPHVPRYRESLSNHYGALAEVLRAMGRPADAVAAMLERQKLAAGQPKELCEIAAAITLAAALVGQDKEKLSAAEQDQRRRYFGLALEALRQARAAGFKDLEQLKTDSRLELLRQDERWQPLLVEFMANAPP
jgi:tetratricopeptide (TPR) repeat protein